DAHDRLVAGPHSCEHVTAATHADHGRWAAGPDRVHRSGHLIVEVAMRLGSRPELAHHRAGDAVDDQLALGYRSQHRGGYVRTVRPEKGRTGDLLLDGDARIAVPADRVVARDVFVHALHPCGPERRERL